MQLPIYMDYHATTPVDPRVLEAMLPYFTDKFGNASSRHHSFGWTAKDAVENARAQVASLIGASASEIVFTSGATESNNLAIRGVAEAYRDKGNHIVSCVTEHRSVIDSCRKVETQGVNVTYLSVGADGRIDLDALRAAITDQTILISVMTANNEIGVLQPVVEIGAIALERGIAFHTDVVQAAGKVPFDVNETHAGLASLSAHKIYGPKGVGALYVRRKPRVMVAEQISGGGHERGIRSGTLNTPGIVGFGAAAAICRAEMPGESARIRQLRDRLDRQLRENLEGVRVNGSIEQRLPNNLNVSFSDLDGDALLMAIDDVALSSGAACTSADRAPSHVLRALGLDEELARASLRFGLGRWTTEAEIDYVAKKVTDVVRHLRKSSPLQPAYAEGSST
jgi:cysteine desulfurase